MSNLEETTVFGIFNQQALPEGATPVSDFDLTQYLGRWYEVARMDFFWEKHRMTNVYAEYRANDNGTVDVLNTGFNENRNKWSSYEGEARFRENQNVAALEVSFFAGAWGGYNVISIDDDYQYALVYGRNLNYLWFLSRERGMPQEIKDKYTKMAQETGYDIDKIHWPDQTREVPPFQQ